MELSECLSWTGRRIWVRMGTGSPTVPAIIVHAFPAPFDRKVIDVSVQLKSGGFTIVNAAQRGIEWDFEPRRGPGAVSGDEGEPEPKSA
jgi:hypothetical protein